MALLGQTKQAPTNCKKGRNLLGLIWFVAHQRSKPIQGKSGEVKLQNSRPDATGDYSMLTSALKLGRLSSWARTFTTSPFLSQSTTEAQKYVQFLSQRSENPVWHLVKRLDKPVDIDYIYDFLRDNKISVEKFRKWELILSQPDIYEAVEALRSRGYKTTPNENLEAENQVDGFTKTSVPSFVLFSLVVHKVKTPAQAAGPLLDLVLSNLDSETHYNRGPLLILTTYQLARFNITTSFQRILAAFLSTTLYIPVIQFNGLVQALSFMSFRASETSKNIMTLFKAMDDRKLKITPSTCKTLLRGELCDVNVAQHLFVYMTSLKNHQLTPDLFEQFIRTFINNHRRDLALRFFRIFEKTMQSASQIDQATQDALSRARISILSSFDSRQEAKEFLMSLSEQHSGEWTKVYNETAVFNVSANDHTVRPKHLIDIFLFLPTTPSVVTYTILIRGLLHRHDFRSAVIYWNKLVKQSKLVIDRNALTAGVEALIRDEQPHEAFQVLEKYCRRPGFDYSDPNYDGPPPVELSTIAMNQILAAMNRIKRPDAVFRLWEHMGKLYGCYPNAMTLSILLQAAKIARVLDDSLSGIMEKIKLLNPFKTKVRPNQPIDRRLEAVNEVISCIGHPSRGELRRYTSGIWRGQEPVEFVTKIFLQALFGNDHKGRLLKVESPASAILKSYDSAPTAPVFSSPMKYVFTPFPDLLTPEGRSHFPQIVVTNVHFLMYITMIGVAGRAGEIPLALAWMKELGVVPSTPLLAASLVFWSEISAQAPLVEMWSGGPEKNEHTKLVHWIREWVGEERMPTDKLLLRWRRVVHDMRTVGSRSQYQEVKDIWS